MKSDQPHLRSGFTLIELLTVCGIISLLLGLSLPAIQGARERARRIQCANNLRQIGVASQSFHSSFQHFPPSPNTWPAKRVIVAAKILPLSAHYYLLPGLDHSALYNQIEFNGEHWTDADPPTSRNNQSCVETFIPVFACPSDNVPAGGTSYLISQGTSTNGYSTPRFPMPNSVRPGVGSGVSARDISDGLSNTIAFSERLIGDRNASHYTPSRDWAYSTSLIQSAGQPPLLPDDTAQRCRSGVTSVQKHASFCGVGWLFGRFGTTSYNHILPPNSPVPDCSPPNGGSGAFSARSYHIGGVYCLLADGAVTFVSDSIDVAVWRAAGTINGRETSTISQN